MACAWAIARLPSAAWGQRGRSCWPGHGPGRRWKPPLAALLALWAAGAPALAQQQRVQPLGTTVAQLSKPNPRSAPPAPPAVRQNTGPANPANRSSTNGCGMNIEQMQQVARGQVLRLGHGDCQMRFNTVR